MALRIEHRTEDGVMVLSTRASLASLATRVVGTGEELVVINQRTGSTLVKFTVPASSPPSTLGGHDRQDHSRSIRKRADRGRRDASALTRELDRYGLTLGWEPLMGEVERRGWYVVPAAPTATSGRDFDASRHVVLGVGTADAHLTVDGWGQTVVEALGWAVARALDAVGP